MSVPGSANPALCLKDVSAPNLGGLILSTLPQYFQQTRSVILPMLGGKLGKGLHGEGQAVPLRLVRASPGSLLLCCSRWVCKMWLSRLSSGRLVRSSKCPGGFLEKTSEQPRSGLLQNPNCTELLNFRSRPAIAEEHRKTLTKSLYAGAQCSPIFVIQHSQRKAMQLPCQAWLAAPPPA